MRSCGRWGLPGRKRRRKVEMQRFGVVWLWGIGIGRGQRTKQVLLLRVSFDQIDFGSVAAGFTQKRERLLVDGEEAHRGADSGAMLATRARSATFNLAKAGPKNSTNLSTTPSPAEDLGHGEDQVGGACTRAAIRRSARSRPPRAKHVERLAEHDRLGLDPADAPAEHAQPVDHRRVASVPTTVSGRPTGPSAVSPQHDALRQILGRTYGYYSPRPAEPRWLCRRHKSPVQKLVAFAITPAPRGRVPRPLPPASGSNRPAPSNPLPGL